MRDGPADEAHQADWDAKSIASTDILSKSEYASSTAPNYDEAYRHYPLLPLTDSPSLAPASLPLLPLDNPSTDRLLSTNDRSEQFIARQPSARGNASARGYRQPHLPMPAGARHAAQMSDVDLSASSPLLAQDPWLNEDDNAYGGGGGDVPYPPSAYTQPPLGYVPPTMRRTASDLSESDVGVAGAGAGAGAGGTRWDTGDREERGYMSRQGSQGYYGGY